MTPGISKLECEEPDTTKYDLPMPKSWQQPYPNSKLDVAATMYEVKPVPEYDSTPAYTWGIAPRERDAGMKWNVLDRKAYIAIMFAGASSCYGRPKVLPCSQCWLDKDPSVSTGHKSGKVFRYASRLIAAADNIKRFKFNVRDEAREFHIVPGIQNSLVSTNQFAKANYISISDKYMVNIYEENITEIRVSGGAVLKGWWVPKECLWQIPLEEINLQPNLNTSMILVNQSMTEMLRIALPPIKPINTVFGLKTK